MLQVLFLQRVTKNNLKITNALEQCDRTLKEVQQC